ncbi:MAG: NUDIX domain-containing protein [Caldilineaceae bacterium]|nr:NUDIX domain-containing protein [Caldilineaceae bacterium]HRJ43654.1 NUDIX domain-containing protein [Caldilineaceae bacterium]
MAVKKYRAAGGVVIQQGQIEGLNPQKTYVLLLNRPDRDEVRLPKGHIDPGEDALTAALRETEEETGFADLLSLADLGNRYVEFDYKNDHYLRNEHYYLMTVRSARRTQRPVHDAEQFQPLWIETDLAVGMLTFEAEQDVVQAAIARYQEIG